MTATTRAAFISAWILGVGLLAVHLEVQHVRSGARIRALLIERDARVESFRRLEMRFNRLISPDLLTKNLPKDFRSTESEIETSEPRT
jgi:hypothetical protein